MTEEDNPVPKSILKKETAATGTAKPAASVPPLVRTTADKDLYDPLPLVSPLKKGKGEATPPLRPSEQPRSFTHSIPTPVEKDNAAGVNLDPRPLVGKPATVAPPPAPSVPSASTELTITASPNYRGIDERPDTSFEEACDELSYTVTSNEETHKVGEKAEGTITWDKDNNGKHELVYQNKPGSQTDPDEELARFMAVMYAGKTLAIHEPSNQQAFEALCTKVNDLARQNNVTPPTLCRVPSPAPDTAPSSPKPY